MDQTTAEVQPSTIQQHAVVNVQETNRDQAVDVELVNTGIQLHANADVPRERTVAMMLSVKTLVIV